MSCIFLSFVMESSNSLKTLKSNNATGPDEIPAGLLDETALEIAHAVTLTFQASLDQRKVARLPQSGKAVA